MKKGESRGRERERETAGTEKLWWKEEGKREEKMLYFCTFHSSAA